VELPAIDLEMTSGEKLFVFAFAVVFAIAWPFVIKRLVDGTKIDTDADIQKGLKERGILQDLDREDKDDQSENP